MTFLTMAWEWLHSHALSTPSLAKFALGMAIIVGIPPLSRHARLPAVVGLLLSGVVLGPHVLGLFGEHAPIADFFADGYHFHSWTGSHRALRTPPSQRGSPTGMRHRHRQVSQRFSLIQLNWRKTICQATTTAELK
jgi:hypothetical protein